MTRKRLFLFGGIVLALILVPTVIPYLIGHVSLPSWAYVIYVFLVLVNAGAYLVNRCVLIDRFLIRGRIRAFLLWNLLALAVASVLELLALDLAGRAVVGGVRVSEILDLGTQISQKTMVGILYIIVVITAVAVSLSDEWRLAAFRYNEASRENEKLGKELDKMQDMVEAMQQRGDARSVDSISVKIDLMTTRIRLSDLLYVKAEGDYVALHLSDGTSPMTLMTLKTLEKQLPFDRFCRVHRSWIVNVDKVRGLKGGTILIDGPSPASIPLSDSCKAAFFELLSHRSILLRTE